MRELEISKLLIGAVMAAGGALEIADVILEDAHGDVGVRVERCELKRCTRLRLLTKAELLACDDARDVHPHEHHRMDDDGGPPPREA